MTAKGTSRKRLIWDLPVRIFHWLLVICIMAQWITAELLEDAMQLHFYIGYFTLGLVIFRILWGFFGPTHARFSQFLRGPTAIIHYSKQMHRSTHTVGHNPLGAVMVVTMLAVLLLQAVSGLFASDDVLYTGPYTDAVSQTWQDFWNATHHTLFNGILALIAFHLLAVCWHQLLLKHNIIGPMLHGKKAASASDGIASSKLKMALVIVSLVAVFVYWLVFIAPPESDETFYY